MAKLPQTRTALTGTGRKEPTIATLPLYADGATGYGRSRSPSRLALGVGFLAIASCSATYAILSGLTRYTPTRAGLVRCCWSISA